MDSGRYPQPMFTEKRLGICRALWRWVVGGGGGVLKPWCSGCCSGVERGRRMDHDGERGQKNARRVKRDLNAAPGRDLNEDPLPRKEGARSLIHSPRSAHTRLQGSAHAAIGVFWKCIRAVRTVRWLWKMPTGHRGQAGCKTRGLRSSASISFSASMAQQDQDQDSDSDSDNNNWGRLASTTVLFDSLP
jgi:hypothetical protein